jgi:PAS domain S-box-containing protein
VARALADADNPDDALASALRVIGTRLGWLWGAVWEPSGHAPERLVCTRRWHAPGPPPEEFESASEQLRLRAGEGLPGRVWRDQRPAWIVDVVAASNFPRTGSAGRSGLHAALCFPIRSSSGVIGVIELLSGEPHEPDTELLDTLSVLGYQIGQVVERRRDFVALRGKEARHTAMLAAALDCVISMDHTGHVLEFNRAAERTFGYSAAEAVGRELAELIVPPSLRDEHRRGLARYLDTMTAEVLDQRVELTAMRADGTEFPVELTITRIGLPGPPVFTGYVRDITDRRIADTELRDSRARIVDAADASRRRLERDLHDGAQQRLVELALDLRMARTKLPSEPDEAAGLLDEALESLRAATHELRELARGIHPAVLTEGGLRPAVTALASRATVPVGVSTVPDGRYPASVEAVVYFTVAEALTNAARHAQATHVEVAVTEREGTVRVEVRDDGIGGAALTGGTGLRGLTDRIAVAGGALELESPRGRGTTVTAEIPCGS